MTDAHEPMIEEPKAEPRSRRISAVWLVPLVALAISLFVAWQSYSERGPAIDIVLDSAAGIEAGKTTIRFRDVNIGIVESVAFSDDLKNVVATARIEKSMARFLDSNAEFWVVRPQVSTQGVTGIETVLSGVYIEAFWSGEPGTPAQRFTALPQPPLTRADQPGLRIRLRAPDGGSLSAGAPVLYKRIPVGRVEKVELTTDGDVFVDLFVNAPYDAFLTEGARFWNASGFSLNLGAGGATISVESLAALVRGGVGFAQIGAQAQQVEAGHVFELYASESAARQNAIEDLPGERVSLNAFFDSSVSGLEPGAKVEFRGVTVGEVTAFQPVVLREGDATRLRMRVTLAIVPQRMGIVAEAGAIPEAGLDLLADLVGQGLRAQLASAGLLGQSLFVNLAELPDAPAAALERDALPLPVIPSAATEASGLAASAEGVMKRLAALPLEDLIRTFTTLLANVNAVVADPNVRTVPANIGALIADIRETVDTSGIKDTPAQIAQTLATIREVVSQVETQELVTALTETIQTTRTTIEKFGVVADGVPALMTSVGGVADEARALPLDDFVASATRTVDGIDALVRSEKVGAIPGSVDAALAEIRGLIADLRAGGTVENVNATVASLRRLTDELNAANLGAEISKAVASAERAAANVDTATAQLPEVIDNLRALSARVEQLPLDQLVAQATRTLDATETLLASDGMKQVPAELSQSLAQVRALVAELREGGAVQNVNSALASADEAAAAITSAAALLPALIERIDRLTATADTTIAGFAPGSELTRETQAMLRDLRNAAQSVNALVIALERKPNSVLFGR
ncbi:MlaD family protein [Amaricoccus sp.]|uniref:MlaD family protein n=1 Tax=Amaricoccus sp. TaxID=1872485 RepID=UPI001B705B52|nr:MlaD family protein [Amaricoccus sp.]MBP7000664.1 MCE family protein [Amaricoccus sp.]